MANVKNGAYREMIIDRCLQNRRGYSTLEIMEKCNDALYRRGEPPITATNTVRNDILSIESRYGILVEAVKEGRNVRYRYEDPDFSIYNTPLTEEDIIQLAQSVSVLKRFDGMPGFEWVNELNAHIQSTVNTENRSVVGFHDNKQLKGIEFFTPLFEHINARQPIVVNYRTYKNSDITAVIHPYFLKQYNQRWYLFGRDDKFGTISNYPLDRIVSVEISPVTYIPNNDIDFSTYFDNVIGVSVEPDTQTEEIRILVNAEQLPYTLSKPLHHTQKLLQRNTDGSGVIAITVIPNFELIQLLLSFGERFVVLSPASVKAEISARVEKNFKNYFQVHLD